MQTFGNMFFRSRTASQTPWVPSIPQVGALKTLLISRPPLLCSPIWRILLWMSQFMCKIAKSKNFVPVHAILVCRETAVAPLIPRIDAKWNAVVSFKPRPLYPQKKSRFPLNRKTCGTQTQTQGGLDRLEKIICFPGFKTLVVQPVVTLSTTL
jgi:hypothetical protein